MKGPLPPIEPWPPILEGRRLPWLVRLRDFLLTLAAWFVLLWLLQDWLDMLSSHMLADLLPPDWERGKVDLPLLVTRLRLFLLTAGAIIGWLLLRAVRDRSRIRAAGQAPQPPPLSLEEQAARFGLPAEVAMAAREHKVSNVWFGEDGGIQKFEAK